jgi:hypothetical protein
MTQETDPGSATPGTPPAGSPRRAARLGHQPATVLPTATPVAHAGTGTTGTGTTGLGRRRTLLLVGGAAAVLLCAAGGVLVVGLRTVPAAHTTTAASDISVAAGAPNPANALLGEGGGAPGPLPRTDPTAPPATPGPTAPAPATPPEEPFADPPAGGGASSGSEGDGTAPGGPAPGTGTPSTPTAPGAPSQPTPPPAAPKPLAFAGLTRNSTIGLLGIRILSSDTLALTGEPGATATVSYGSSPAGSVTFDGSGRATLTAGGSLIDLGDPVITVAYSDGTAGPAIHARRSAL